MSPSRQVDLSIPENLVGIALEAKHNVDLLQSSMKQSMDTVVSRLDSVGAEQREMTKSLRLVAETVAEMQSRSEAIERLGRAIDRNTTEQMTWRDKHEAENRAVADRVTRFTGILVGFGTAGMLIMSLASYVAISQFDAVRAERLAAEATTAQGLQYLRADMARLEARIEVVAKEAKATRELR